MGLLGHRFGNLKVIAAASTDTFLCRCGDHGRDAPKLVLLSRAQLLGGVTSCGCIKAKTRKKKAAALA